MNARTLSLLFAVCLAAACLAGAGCGGDFAGKLAAAEKAYEDGDPVGAQDLARALVKESPADEVEAVRFADLLIRLAEPGGALDFLGKHARDDSPEASDVRIAALLASDRVPEAEKEIGSRFAGGTDTARTAQLRGQLFIRRGKFHDAKRALVDSQGRDDKDPLTWALLGLATAQLGERDAAEKLLWEGHRRFPKSCDIRKTLAGVLLPGRENLKETLEAVAELLGYIAEHRPLDLPARTRLGTVLNRLGRHLEARRVLEKLTKDDPTRSGPWADLGVACAQLGDFDAAARAFLTAATIDPTNVPLLLNLGNSYLEVAARARDRGPPLDRAEQTFARVIEVGGKNPEALVGLGRAAVKRNPASDPQAEEAIHLFRQALDLDPDSFAAHLQLGLLYYDLWIPVDKTKSEGHWRALEHFEKAEKLVPLTDWTRSSREAYEDLKSR